MVAMPCQKIPQCGTERSEEMEERGEDRATLHHHRDDNPPRRNLRGRFSTGRPRPSGPEQMKSNMENEPLQVTPSWGNDKWSDPDAASQRTDESGSDAPTCSAWLPMESAPKDREILVCWGTVASGAMGCDIVKHLWDEKWQSVLCSDRYPADGFHLQGWVELPPLPNAKVELPPNGGSESKKGVVGG